MKMTAKFRRLALAATCYTLFIATPGVAYGCRKADPPAIPETADISIEELLALKKKVHAYIESAQHYVVCQHRQKKIDAAIKEMKLVAANYNVLIVLYKESLTEEEALQLSDTH